MTKTFSAQEPGLQEYVEQTFRSEDSTLKEIRERSTQAGLPAIQVGSVDILHLEVLALGVGAHKIVEIGTLGGYSGIAFARAAGPQGKLWTFELQERHAAEARESFKKAGVGSRVEVLVGPALQNLPKIEKEGPFDLVFIDADKANYSHYLEWADRNLRLGGVVLADNTFGFGYIHLSESEVPEDSQKSVAALKEFNKKIANHPHFRATLLPTGEGLTMGVKIK